MFSYFLEKIFSKQRVSNSIQNCIMKIICPNCRESYIFDLDSINIEPISKAVIETRDFLKGEINQINNIIN